MSRYVRFEKDGKSRVGVLHDGAIVEIEGKLFGPHRTTEVRHDLETVKILPPCTPAKVIGTFINDSRFYPPEVPPWNFTHWYLKTPDSVIGVEDEIEIPHFLEEVECELELVAVIGRTAKNVSVEQAMNHIFGFTIGNDVTVSKDAYLRRPPLGPLRLVPSEGFSFGEWLKEIDGVMSISLKATDTFAPIGPCIATDLDLSDLRMSVRINGQERAQGSTATMLESPAKLVSDISQAITLRPGDLVFTGTQTGLLTLRDGDLVELEIEDIGVLRNRVAKVNAGHKLQTVAGRH